MRRVLIDLTDLELWGGNHGGTQRVVYGIAKQYFLRGDTPNQKLEFISFDPKSDAFYETSFEPIYKRVEQSNAVASENVIQGNGLPLKTRIKYKLKPYIPEAIKKNTSARLAAQRSINVAKKAVKTARTSAYLVSARKTRIKGNKIVFSEQDTVLILGKPWDNPELQRYVSAQKLIINFKLVQVVYDLIIPLRPHLHHQTLFKNYTQHMFEAIMASDLMLPISKSSEKDLKLFSKALNLPVPRTKVIRLAEDISSPDNIQQIRPDSRIQDTFIACIGTIEIRKNHMLLYYAYKQGLESNIELPQLVIVGSRGWLSGDFQYLVENDPQVSNKIIILDNLGDNGLDWIYRNCLFTVYPSMYEGWGLPVAESLAYGKVCMSSQTSSMPEIAGDLIDYFSPYDANECMKMIAKYTDSKLLPKKENKIKNEYKPRTWKDTYVQVSNLIDKS